MSDKIQNELAALRKEVHAQGIRLTLAQGWINLYVRAYDALLHYGINFKTLREYKEKYPHGAENLPLSQSRDKYVSWFGRIESAISAAIRRKGFKVHENPEE